jgi:DedD protein
MTEQSNWKASLTEHRTAWIVASCCLLVILTAAIKPDLFEFPQHESVGEEPAVPASMEEIIAEQIAPPIEDEAEAVVVEAAKEIAPPKAVITPSKPVVEKTPAKPTPAPSKAEAATKPSAPAAGYYVQLGAFGERPRAQGLVDQLKLQGWSAVIAPKPGGLHAVWAGPEKDRGSAERLQKEIERKLKTKGFVVQQKGA